MPICQPMDYAREKTTTLRSEGENVAPWQNSGNAYAKLLGQEGT